MWNNFLVSLTVQVDPLEQQQHKDIKVLLYFVGKTQRKNMVAETNPQELQKPEKQTTIFLAASWVKKKKKVTLVFLLS